MKKLCNLAPVSAFALVGAAVALAALPARAQLVGGSTGSLGPCDFETSQSVALPADGIFNCTTIMVASGVTLTFQKNSLNTPVYLLATDAVTINGTIDVSASRDAVTNDTTIGGPGGFDGGPRGFGSAGGPGRGPGGGAPGDNSGTASTAGGGAYGSAGVRSDFTGNGAVYGSPLLVPLVGGSGGGGIGGSPGQNGGGGGGAVLVASEKSVTINGAILARGGFSGSGCWSEGSGGAIRIVAPDVLGGGQLQVQGGSCQYTAGMGRVRIDTIHRAAVTLSFTPLPSVASVGSFMVVFPNPLPRLDIKMIGSTTVTGGSALNVILSNGSSPTQDIKVEGQDWPGGSAQVMVRLEPSSGAPTLIGPTTVPNGTLTPISATFDVNNPTHVLVYRVVP